MYPLSALQQELSRLIGQLSLFLDYDKDIGIRPERLLRDMGEMEFIRRHQCSVRSLAAFEKSTYPDDWRELMRLYMVRRTRSFIQDNYAQTDPDTGRKFLTFADEATPISLPDYREQSASKSMKPILTISMPGYIPIPLWRQ